MPQQSSTSSPGSAKSITCPQCGCRQLAGVLECGRCSIVLAKWRPPAARPVMPPQPSAAELELRQRGALLAAMMMGQRYHYKTRRLQSVAAKAVWVGMAVTLAGFVFFSVRVGAPRGGYVNKAMGIYFDMPPGWQTVGADRHGPFLSGLHKRVPDVVIRDVAEHLSQPSFGLVLAPAQPAPSFIVVSLRDKAALPLTRVSVTGLLEGELAAFPKSQMGPVELGEQRGMRVFSALGSASFDSYEHQVRFDYVVTGRKDYLLTWVGPPAADPRVMDDVASSFGMALRSSKDRWVAAGMIQLWLLSLIMGFAVVMLRIYRRME